MIRLNNIKERSQWIKEQALQLGFCLVGIANAGFMDEEAKRLETWLNMDRHGSMSYMANHFDKRVNPQKLVPGAQSVISLAYNYHNPEKQKDKEAPKISQYAYGQDYHFVIKDKLKELLERMRNHIGHIEGRCFVDSAPVLERDWAKRSGLGWIGKNTLLINPKKGSLFFLAELITDLRLIPDIPLKDYCGTCRRCIDACPTNAIDENGYLMDGSKCISYFTIELKDQLPDEYKGKFDNWMFGCDICQDVCPWNRFSSKHNEAAFEPPSELMEMTRQDWIELTEETFQKVFKKSAVKRTKFEGLKRNINFLTKK